MAPGDLEQALCDLHLREDPNLIASFRGAEDAGVYKINDSLALVHTVDFFTPIVDDPYTFGQIAAANSLSDVYAMGATPINALNVVAFPISTMNVAVLQQIIRGGVDKLNEAQVSLIGGHSIEDQEIKYGFAVTGIVDPQKVLLNCGALPGDKILLTKPLGTAIINTAMKRGKVDVNLIDLVQKTMVELNRTAAEVMKKFAVHACTDVTGFGLLGHLAEIVDNSGVGALVESHSIPIFPQVKELAKAGFAPGGTKANREFRQNMVSISQKIAAAYSDILYDPQTSGGLLIVVADTEAQALCSALQQHGVNAASIIGEITTDAKIVVT